MSEAVEPDSSRLTALAVALFQRIVLTVTAAAVLATMPPDITAATLIHHLIGSFEFCCFKNLRDILARDQFTPWSNEIATYQRLLQEVPKG
jgi:hypothetical protein